MPCSADDGDLSIAETLVEMIDQPEASQRKNIDQLLSEIPRTRTILLSLLSRRPYFMSRKTDSPMLGDAYNRNPIEMKHFN